MISTTPGVAPFLVHGRLQAVAAKDLLPAADRRGGARIGGRSFESALQRAAFGTATGFASASGALAEYIDPDDVSPLVPTSHFVLSTAVPG